VARLGRETYWSKVYGCWLGKSIGGTLGGPHEGQPGPLNLTFYDPVPTEPAFNDDLDLQLVWLHALEEHGPQTTPAHLSQAWLEHITYPWCEYGFSQLNARRGLLPPVTGSYDNWFGDCMGAPIRSEIWACVAPACPHVACEYAWRDAVRDHWGEGVWGELFLAAVESAAFVISDVQALLEIGLAAIPPWCKVARAIAVVRDSHASGEDWLRARERVLAQFDQQHPTHAPQNLAFIVLGWLYGEDFGDALLKAVNCGRDTDCTGATLGSILGIVHGAEAIPARWREPIAEGIKVGWGIVGLEVPTTLAELTRRTLAVGERMLAPLSEIVQLVDGQARSGDADALRRLASQAMQLWDRKPDEIWLTDDGRTRVWYMGGPAMRAGGNKRLMVLGTGGVGVKAPAGWKVDVRRVDHAYELTVFAPPDMGPWAALEITAEGERRRVALVRQPEWQVARQPAGELGAQPPAIAHWLPWLADGYQMDFTPLLGGQPGMVVARTAVVSPTARAARLIVTTPHPARAWLNQALVISKDSVQPNDSPPYNTPGDTHAAVELRAGQNELVVAINSAGGACQARIYFVDEVGHGLPEVVYVMPGSS
jgi:hypothetical protein